MPEVPDYEVSAEDHAAYVSGENAAKASPIGVEIVGEVAVKEFPARSWTAQQTKVDDTTVQQLAGALPQRTMLVITNMHPTSVVYLSPTRESCTVGRGYALLGAQTIKFAHTDAVFAICDVAAPCYVGVASEYRDGGA